MTISVLSIAKAQEIIVPFENGASVNIDGDNNAYYIKDVNNVLDKFVGTWESTNGLHYFKITFTKKLHYNSNHIAPGFLESDDYSDMLTTKFLYTYNGVEVYNTYESDMVYNKTSDEFYFRSFFMGDTNRELMLYYDEPSLTLKRRNRKASLKVTFNSNGLGTSDDTITWVRSDEIVKKLVHKAKGVDFTEFKIPSNMTLTKL